MRRRLSASSTVGSSTITRDSIRLRYRFSLIAANPIERTSEVEIPRQRQRDGIRAKLRRLAFSHSQTGCIEDFRHAHSHHHSSQLRPLFPEWNPTVKIRRNWMNGTISQNSFNTLCIICPKNQQDSHFDPWRTFWVLFPMRRKS